MNVICQSCEWTGPVEKTVHLKHDPSYPLCPECYDAIEEAYPVALGDCPGSPIEPWVELDEPEKGHAFDEMWGIKNGT